MTVQELRDILNDPILDERLEIGYPDNCIEPTGLEPIERVTEVYNGFNQIIGYAIV